MMLEDSRVKMGSERTSKHEAEFLLLSLVIIGRYSMEKRM